MNRAIKYTAITNYIRDFFRQPYIMIYWHDDKKYVLKVEGQNQVLMGDRIAMFILAEILKRGWHRFQKPHALSGMRSTWENVKGAKYKLIKI